MWSFKKKKPIYKIIKHRVKSEHLLKVNKLLDNYEEKPTREKKYMIWRFVQKHYPNIDIINNMCDFSGSVMKRYIIEGVKIKE